MDKIYLTENWHVWLPEDFVFSKLLAHLIQILEELPDVAVVWIEALDVDKLLLVLVQPFLPFTAFGLLKTVSPIP